MLTMKPDSAMCQVAKTAVQSTTHAGQDRLGVQSLPKDSFMMPSTQNIRYLNRYTRGSPLVERYFM